MFHQFFNENFYNCKGAVGENEFYNFCKKLKAEFNVVDPKDHEQISDDKSILLTFDDGLRSQSEVALKILDIFNIKALFFVFSSIFTNNFNLIEIFKYFSHVYFESIDDFYKQYFNYLFKNENSLQKILLKYERNIKTMKSNSPFYSLNDIIYRLLRFEILSNNEFNESHLYMIKKISGKNIDDLKVKLHFGYNDIEKLISSGNVIGNHSHSHSYDLHKKSFEDQFNDYKKCNSILKNICKSNLDYCSFPFGMYSNDTLKVLEKLEFKYSFLANHNSNFINKKIINRFDHNLLISKNNVNLEILK